MIQERSPAELEQIRQAAIAGLRLSGRRLHDRLLSGDIKEMVWTSPVEIPSDGIMHTKVGKGRIILRQPETNGVGYVASFGPNSGDSYAGFLPHVTLEEAKLLVYGDVKKYNRW